MSGWVVVFGVGLGIRVSRVERKSQTIKYITEIRVGKTTTLKIANCL